MEPDDRGVVPGPDESPFVLADEDPEARDWTADSPRTGIGEQTGMRFLPGGATIACPRGETISSNPAPASAREG
jgi:hypothetical protein